MYNSLCFAKILEAYFRDQPLLLMILVCTSLPNVGPFPSTAEALDLTSSAPHGHSSGSQKPPVLVYSFADFPARMRHAMTRVQLIMLFRQQKKLGVSGSGDF